MPELIVEHLVGTDIEDLMSQCVLIGRQDKDHAGGACNLSVRDHADKWPTVLQP